MSLLRTIGCLTLACGTLLVSDLRAEEKPDKPEPRQERRRQREDAAAPRERPRDAEARDGNARKEGPRDGDRPREGARDGDRAKEGPRDGDRPREGARDGDRPREGPPGNPRERADRLAKVLAELNLSEEQKAQIQKIQEEARAKGEKLREELKDLPPEERREKARQAMGDIRAKIEAVLTDEQKQQLREKLQAERPRDGDRPREGARDGDRPKDGPRDGDRPRDGARDGDRPRDGARDGDRPKDGPRDGDRPRQGPRDGERPRNGPPPGDQGARLEEDLPAADRNTDRDSQAGPRAVVFERIRSNLDKLDLTPDQKKQSDAILADAADKLARLREQNDLDNLREQAGAVFNDVRTQIADLLTPAQRAKMAELMPRRPDGEGPPGERPRAKPNPSEPKADATPNSDTTAAKAAAVSSPASSPFTSSPSTSPASADDRFAPGTPAPDFRLKNLSGKLITLQSLRGKPTVIVFGSFSSPTARDRLPQFDALRKGYRSKANFVFVYTREAYPYKEWELKRNVDEQIKVDPHADYADRSKMAKLTREGMKLEMEVLVDDVDDGVATTYDAMPNGCIVLDAAGRIVGKQKWADPHGAKVWLDETLRAK